MSGSLYDPAISRLMQTNPELAAIERRRMLAAMLMQQGQQNQKITHPLQIAGNLANTAVAALMTRKADEEGKALTDQWRADVKDYSGKFRDLLTGGGETLAPAGLMTAPPPAPVQRENVPPLSGSTLAVPENLRPIIQQASEQSGVPFNIIAAKLQQESGFRPDARGTSGEVGISQIMPSTAAQPGYGLPPISMADAADPTKAIPWGAQYLAARAKAQGVNDWNDPTQAAKGLAAYNGSGPAAEGYGRQVASLAGLSSGESFPKPQQTLPGAGTLTPDSPMPQMPGINIRRFTELVMQGMQDERPHIQAQAQRYLPLLAQLREQMKPGPTVSINGPQGPGQYERLPDGGLRFLGGTVEAAPVSPARHAQDLERAAAGRANTSLTVDQRTEGEEAKAYGKEMGQQAAAVHTEANQARTSLSRLQQFEALSQGFQTGKLAPAQTTVAGWAQALGLDPTKIGVPANAAINGEALRSINNALTLSLIGSGGMPANNFSNADRQFISEIVPSLSNTPGANAIIAFGMRKAAERTVEKEDMWLAARERGQSYGQFLKDWNTHVKANPIVQEVQKPEDAEALPPGTIYRRPDGQYVIR